MLERLASYALVALWVLACGGDDDGHLDASTDAGVMDSGATDAAAGAEDGGPDACSGVEICNGLDDDCSGAADDGPQSELCPGGGRCMAGRCGRGNLDWETTVRGSYGATGLGAVVGMDGNPVILAQFPGRPLSIGDVELASGNSLLISLDADDATTGWATRVGAPGTRTDRPSAITRASDGTLFAVGLLAGAATFGTVELEPDDMADGYVVRVAADGTVEHAWLLGAAASGRLADVRVTPSGDVVVVGSLSGALTVGDTTVETDTQTVLVARFDADGSGIDTFILGTGGYATGMSVALAPDGDVFVGGEFDTSIDFGTDSFTSSGGLDGFVARLSATGELRWAKHFGTRRSEEVSALVATSGGGVCAGGMFGDAYDFGFGELRAEDNRDGFVVCYDGDGTARWADRAGGGRGSPVTDMAIDGDDNVFVVGAAHPATSPGYGDPFAVAFGADGNRRWSRIISTPTYSDYAAGVAVGANHDVYVTGGPEPVRVWRFGY